MKKTFLGLLVGGLALASSAGPALGATVTVRVEGSDGAVIAPTTVTTGSAPVLKDGTHACAGSSAAGALELATAGDWGGTWDAAFNTYGVERIKNLNYGAFSASTPYFWAFVINGAAADGGVCAEGLQEGDDVVFYTGCNAASTGCYPFDSASLQAAAPATAAPGQAFAVSVKTVATTFDSSPPYASHVTSSPASGATVAAAGTTATTDAAGSASLTLAERGPVTVRVTRGPKDVPYERLICVTDGQDGFCGTTKPSDPGTGTGILPISPPPCHTTGDDGRCGSPDKRAAYGFIGSVKEGQRFAKGSGPRELAGRVEDEPSGIKGVEVRLTRTNARRCTTYDGARERFVKLKRCGAQRGRWFTVGDRADWKYLLPAKLGKGRYVLDLRVTDKQGNQDTTLARGRNRVVFHVA